MMCVLRPPKVVLLNYPQDQVEYLSASYWPRDVPKEGNRPVAFTRELYIEQDASLVEVNPLIVTSEGKLVALDAKIGIDSNALFRHPALVALRDVSQEDPIEARAARCMGSLARRASSMMPAKPVS